METIKEALIEFYDSGEQKEVGRLYVDEKDGKLKFSGNIDASAKVFFEHLIKQYCDSYIEKEIAKRKKNENR